jgi:hypothetical protein
VSSPPRRKEAARGQTLAHPDIREQVGAVIRILVDLQDDTARLRFEPAIIPLLIGEANFARLSGAALADSCDT